MTSLAPDPTVYRVREALAAHDRGWKLFPTAGKKPLKGTHGCRGPMSDRDTVERFARFGREVGFATGKITVVDIDPRHDGDAGPLALPRTVTANTGGGGQHYYYITPPGVTIGNSAGKLGPGVDVRGEGGYVLIPGSIHPETGKAYEWAPGLSPDDVPFAPLPPHIVERLVSSARKALYDWTATDVPTGKGYGAAALDREIAALAAAGQGTRNSTLNTCAFNLGQLVGGGVLERVAVEGSLRSVFVAWDEPAKSEATMARALDAGARSPRGVPERPAPAASRSTEPADPAHEILVPGAFADDQGGFREVSSTVFVQDVLRSIPPDGIYMLADSVVEMLGSTGHREARPIAVERMRAVIDAHCRLFKWVTVDEVIQAKFVPCSRDLASLVAGNVHAIGSVRRIDTITRYPMFLQDGSIARPGWNACGNVYYDEPPELAALRPADTIDWALIEEVIYDFPFKTEADRQNLIGAIITPLVRPMIQGHVPIHLVAAPLEGTGKSTLVDDVVGRIVTGEAIGSSQLGDDNTEIRKLITSKLLNGTRLVHFDNLRDHMDSEVISSLITSAVWEDRVLGASRVVRLPNSMIVFASGNNVRVNRELARRTVPIFLQPKTSRPEHKSDAEYRHPDLISFVMEHRVPLLSNFLGMVKLWQEAGAPQAKKSLGSFRSWAKVVGGVLESYGLNQWLDNVGNWITSADNRMADLEQLVSRWWVRWQTATVTAKQLSEIASEAGLFPDIFSKSNERASLTAFGFMLAKRVDCPVGERQIVRHGSGNNCFYSLVPLAPT